MSVALVLEVMDKEPGILFWCLWSLVAGLAGLITCLRFPRWVFVFVPLYSILGWFATVDLRDPYVNGPILEEAGLRYFILTYLAVFCGITMPILGSLLSKRTRESRE